MRIIDLRLNISMVSTNKLELSSLRELIFEPPLDLQRQFLL